MTLKRGVVCYSNGVGLNGRVVCHVVDIQEEDDVVLDNVVAGKGVRPCCGDVDV